jgi:RNA polymerase sigma-70 factor (sigma-E family)
VDRDEDFASYVTARWPSLVRSATFLGCTVPEAEDVVQTALVRCYRSWDRVCAAGRMDAYVYKVLLNTLAKSGRRHWSRERATEVPPEFGQPDFAHEVDARTDLGRALSRLRREHREVLVLRFGADLTERQVAEALGIPLGTVKSRVSRAIAAIDRTELREETL